MENNIKVPLSLVRQTSGLARDRQYRLEASQRVLAGLARAIPSLGASLERGDGWVQDGGNIYWRNHGYSVRKVSYFARKQCLSFNVNKGTPLFLLCERHEDRPLNGFHGLDLWGEFRLDPRARIDAITVYAAIVT